MSVWFASRDHRLGFMLTSVAFQPDIVDLGLFFSGVWITIKRPRFTLTTRDRETNYFINLTGKRVNELGCTDAL